MQKLGKWHGDRHYVGFHYDLHADERDTELGTRCTPEELVPMLRRMKPDFVQTDCKGHPGMTSWESRVKDATVSPGVKKDALLQWREATRLLKMPLHCHYSGIVDRSAAKKHPEWCVVPVPGGEPDVSSGQMCPRSEYVDALMIPQLKELMDRYGVDGFWVDGDIWGGSPCYCSRCLAEYEARTGKKTAPVDPEEPDWGAWMAFQLDSFNEYVTRYTEAVHAHKPGVLVCSNWSQTLRNPGDKVPPTDWISGDNAWKWGLDDSRCEARWLSNRGKPWDIMLWSFGKTGGMDDGTSPWTMKPVQMLEQEAAMLLSTGGNVQVYETASGVRTGQLVPWRMERLGEVARFVKSRRRICQNTESFPMAAVLHSEVHYYSKPTGRNLLWGYDVSSVKGATWCLSDCHIGVDILDEAVLKEELEKFPVVVVPEQTRLSEEMVSLLKSYVQEGGLLFLTGAGMVERFGKAYLGIEAMSIARKRTYYLPIGSKKSRRSFPLYSGEWGEMTPMKGGVRAIGTLGKTPLLTERLTSFPAAVMKRHGEGRVLTIPADVFRDFAGNRYPDTQVFVKEMMAILDDDSPIEVDAPTGIEFVARVGKEGLFLHFINRGSGLPTCPNQGMVDEIPPLGPIHLTLYFGMEPVKVKWLFEEESAMSWEWLPKEHEECHCGEHHHHHEDGEECHCGEHHHHHEDDEDGCCCHVEEGESGVLNVTIQQVRLHGVLQVVL